jgi:Zn-dependent M28 family amino/carboxypeptidase
MVNRWSWIVITLALVLPGIAQTGSNFNFPPESVLEQIRPAGIRAHMEFLADDLLEGRGTGTRGYQLAANYVRAQFEELGLKPAGTNGSYFQDVPFRRITLVPESSSVSVKESGQEQKLAYEKDYVLRGDPLKTDAVVDAPVVFVGFGVTAPEFGYDDYAGADTKGKIVAMFYGAPAKFPSAPRAHYSALRVKLATAVAHGAIGYVLIWAGQIEERIPFSRVVRFYREQSLRWLDKDGTPNDAEPQIRASATLSKSGAAILFEGAPKTLAEAIDTSAKGQTQSFQLARRMTIHVVSRHTPAQSPNIGGILPGSDEKLKNEYVVYTAHADHLGIGEAINGDSIYNGAIDNASGTAAVLELAHVFSELPRAPRRSILFLIVTGEEEGLLGSDYYAHYPTVPISQIAANVNMDGVSLLYDFRDIVPLGAEHSSLGTVVNQVAQHFGLEVSPDPLPEEVFFIRSDQYSFVRQGVPAVAITEGFKAVDPKINGKDVSLEWERTRYHTPKDDMQQSLNLDAAAKLTRVDFAVGYSIAQADNRPAWNQGDFFARVAEKEKQDSGRHSTQ